MKEQIENDGEHSIHSNDDLWHSAHCVSVGAGPDDQMGWTYLESHQRWYGRCRSRESGQCRFQPGRISTSPDRQARGKMDCRGVVYDRQYGIWDVPVGYPGRRLQDRNLVFENDQHSANGSPSSDQSLVLQGDAFEESVGNHSRFSIRSPLSLKAGESGANRTWGIPEENASGSATIEISRLRSLTSRP